MIELSAEPLVAMCIAAKPPTTYWGEPIALSPAPGVPRAAVQAAIDMWRRCGGYSETFPGFVVGRGPARTVEVQVVAIGSDGRCGWFSGNRIRLYAMTHQRDGELFHCGPLAQNLAHELGHLLGLGHPARTAACAYHVMSRITARNLGRRSVQAEECRAVGGRFTHPAASSSGRAKRW